MSEQSTNPCPECDATDGVDRRNFLMAVGGTAVTLAGLEAIPQAAKKLAAQQNPQPTRTVKPAEALVRELFQGLTEEQRRQVVLPWNHGGENNATPTRKRMYNAP